MHAIPMIGGAHYATLECVRLAGAGGLLSHRRPADRGGTARSLNGGALRRPTIPSPPCRSLRTGDLSDGDRARARPPRRLRDALAWLWRRGDEQRDVWPRLPGIGAGRQRLWSRRVAAGRQRLAQLRLGAGLALHVPDPSLWVRRAKAALAPTNGGRRGNRLLRSD